MYTFRGIVLDRQGGTIRALRVTGRACALLVVGAIAVAFSGCAGFDTPDRRAELSGFQQAAAAAGEPDAPVVRDGEGRPLSDPSREGPYQVGTFRYGSEHNPRRPEYRDAAVESEPFDISPFFDGVNESFWGFDASEVPVNGMVWHPEGSGPFPVVLVVHGNHNPGAFSEGGYDYLGRLLASRGSIVVSVDQNFLNGPHTGENDARAVLLLEHAARMGRLNGDEGSPLAGRVDTDRIVLMGHSRGGEAAAVAAILNEKDYYPDDGTVELDYDLPIRGVVSIAPVEGQYRPAERELAIPPEVAFLVLHGSQDGDVSQHMGLRFFSRMQGAPETGERAPRNTVWIYGANHAQFNSRWARGQDPRPSPPGALLSAEDQFRAASVFMSAFVELAFAREPAYGRLLENPALGAAWLPETEYRTQYRGPGAVILNSFQDDADFRTAALPGWRNELTGASFWAELPARLGDEDWGEEHSEFARQSTYGLVWEWEAAAGNGRNTEQSNDEHNEQHSEAHNEGPLAQNERSRAQNEGPLTQNDGAGGDGAEGRRAPDESNERGDGAERPTETAATSGGSRLVVEYTGEQTGVGESTGAEGGARLVADALSIDLALLSWIPAGGEATPDGAQNRDGEAESPEAFDAALRIETSEGVAETSLAAHRRITEVPRASILGGTYRHDLPETIWIDLDELSGVSAGQDLLRVEIEMPDESSGRVLITSMLVYGELRDQVEGLSVSTVESGSARPANAESGGSE